MTPITPRILSAGNDPMLLQSRKLILEHAGFDVVACEAKDAIEKVRQEPLAIDGVVLCQSIELAERVAMAKAIRQIAGRIGIVLIHYPGDRFDARVCDSVVETLCPPDSLVRAVRGALKRRGQQP
jgi:hypothetical protein